MVTLDSLKLGGFDLVTIDVQGAEQHVIIGGLETLTQAKALFLECNIGAMYDGDVPIEKLINLLEPWFTPLHLVMTPNKWGDVFFVSKKYL